VPKHVSQLYPEPEPHLIAIAATRGLDAGTSVTFDQRKRFEELIEDGLVALRGSLCGWLSGLE
jgi:hypothetical protein